MSDNREGVVVDREIHPYLSASQDDLSGHEDEEHNLGLDHMVDQTREQLR